MLTTAPTPQFTQSVLANLAYWQQKCATGQAEVGRLANDFSNLLRALQFGLGLPATQTATARLMLAANSLVDANGHYAPWLNFLKKALETCGPTDDELQYLLLDNIGQFYERQFELAPALEWHHRAAAVAARLPSPVPLGRVYFSLCHDYFRLAQTETALHYARQAQAIFAAHGSVGQQAAIAFRLGEILKQRGELGPAEAALRASLAQWPPDYPNDHALLYCSLAQLLGATHRPAEAEACYQAARAILEPTANVIGLIHWGNDYGTFLFAAQKYTAAAAIFRATEAHLRVTPVPQLQADLYNNLGNVLLALANYPAAAAYLREAQALYAQLRMDVGQGNAGCTLGEVLARQGCPAEAVTTYDQSLALLARYPQDAFARHLVRKYTQHRDLVAAGRSVDEYVPAS